VVIPNARKRPNLLKSTLEDDEGHGATKGTFRERKRLKRYSAYVSYMRRLIEEGPSTFEEFYHQEEICVGRISIRHEE